MDRNSTVSKKSPASGSGHTGSSYSGTFPRITKTMSKKSRHRPASALKKRPRRGRKPKSVSFNPRLTVHRLPDRSSDSEESDNEQTIELLSNMPVVPFSWTPSKDEVLGAMMGDSAPLAEVATYFRCSEDEIRARCHALANSGESPSRTPGQGHTFRRPTR